MISDLFLLRTEPLTSTDWRLAVYRNTTVKLGWGGVAGRRLLVLLLQVLNQSWNNINVYVCILNNCFFHIHRCLAFWQV